MKKSFTSPKRSVRSFLLLELLVATALLSFCLFPMLKTHLGIRAMQTKRLKEMRYQSLSHLALLELKTKLYENVIPWKELLTQTSGVLEEVDATYVLRFVGESNKTSLHRHYIAVRAEIVFKEGHTYEHTFLIERETS